MIDKQRLDLLLSTATSMGLKPQQLTDYGLVSLEIHNTQRFVFHLASNPNSVMASLLSRNKHASRVALEKHGLPNIPFLLPTSNTDAKAFLTEHGRIIVKPIKGEKSQHIHLVQTPEEIDALDLKDCILEKFIKGQEVRFLVAEGEVKAVHHKMHEGEDINNPDTVKRVSIERENWNQALADLAVKGAEALGLIFTAVDFLVTDTDEAFVLEVNSAPGIQRFQEPDEGPAIDAMRMYLELVIKNYS
jgi:glutathione synthase/RimK-type ligase-like ATP-grasp enzyme